MNAAATDLHEVLMPRLSDTMTEGIIGRWTKTEGEAVAAGETIVEIETDKVTVTLEAPADGAVLRLLANEGEAVPPGDVIAWVGPLHLADTIPPSPGRATSPPPPTTEAAPAAGERRSPTPSDSERPAATPLARRLAAEARIDLRSLGAGSGPGGRILRQDVERVATSGAVDEHVVVPSRTHAALVRRMSSSKREIPHYYVDTVADVTDLLATRARFGSAGGRRVSLNACIVRAAALALRSVPRVNASWVDDRIVLHTTVNVGLAVAGDDELVVVPVVRSPDTKTVAELTALIDRLVLKAREGQLTVQEAGDASFTVTNLGMFGVDAFHAIINPPESGILAVGSVRSVPALEDGTLRERARMHISLSADHRVFSGATAARFLADVRSRLEHPNELLA